MTYTAIYLNKKTQSFSRSNVFYSTHNRTDAWKEANSNTTPEEILVVIITGSQETYPN
jgi:hypothetical protein